MDVEKELTKQEVNTLIESLDSWVNKDFGGSLMIGLVGMVLSKDAPPEIKEQIRLDRKKDEIEAKKKKQLRSEQAIILKVKLLKIRDGIEAEAI